MELEEFKVGDKVKHKSSNDFTMVIVEFAVHWYNNPSKVLEGVPNPEYPICTYYNKHTLQWERKMFHYSELELV